MRADVKRELRLGCERHGAAVAVQRLVGHVRPSTQDKPAIYNIYSKFFQSTTVS